MVPSAAMRSGDFSALLKGARPTPLIDPLTRQPFPDNIIPANRISPQAQFFLTYMPLAEPGRAAPAAPLLTNNLTQDQTEATSASISRLPARPVDGPLLHQR